ncbi:thiamine pyrophosphate-binding protein [Peptoanaerobacter stomatis]
MRLSDYVISFFEEKKVKDIFLLPGGGCMYLVDSAGKNKNISHISMFHEQAISIAMDSYAQNSGNIGVGIVTTGPGGTNTITGLTASYIDSTPVIYISGQVKTIDMMTGKGIRQGGPQEVDIVSIVKPVTKYAVTVKKADNIKYHLEKAYYEATTGRKGPVWIDIPLDVQGAEIDENNLKGYEIQGKDELNIDYGKIINLINNSQRPLILMGNGVYLSGKTKELLDFIQEYNIPTLLTWKVIDAMEYENKLNFGCPGIMGMRYSNFILQNSDLLLIFGSRLDNSITAYNINNFAKNAKKVIVDIDENEIKKFDYEFYEEIVSDFADFFDGLYENKDKIQKNDYSIWIEYCNKTKEKYPVVLAEYKKEDKYVDSYAFIDVLCDNLKDDDVIVPESSGGAGEITYQAFRIKKNQKMKNAAGLGSMGFGLPYSIGACFANNKKRTILINGDGAFQLNIQELQNIVRDNLPIKMFIWNNDGYASIKNTQKNLFDANYVSVDEKSGLDMPDISAIARAYGIRTVKIFNNSELLEGIKDTLSGDEPVLCEVMTNPMQEVRPKVQSIRLKSGSMMSKPIEDMYPFLSDEELKSNFLK